MTKEQLDERITLLTNQRDSLNQQLSQIGANINAFSGAIQECQYWLGQVDIVAPVPEE